MGNVEALFFKIVLFGIYAVLFSIGIKGILRIEEGKSSRGKYKYIFFIVLPIVLILSSYFSGCYRSAPVDGESLNEIAIAIKTRENEKGQDYYTNEITYFGGKDYTSSSRTPYKCKVQLLEDKPQVRTSGFLDKEVTTDMGTFVCTPISSDRYSSFEVVLHDGYDGSIWFYDSDDNVYFIDYGISRFSDLFCGLIYAPPVFGKCDIANLIKTKQGYCEDAAYTACFDYMSEHYSDYVSEDYSEGEDSGLSHCDIRLVSDYNKNWETKDFMYNKNVFPKIDEKYNDKYVVFFYDGTYSDYLRVTSAVLFVVEVDNGKIVEVIDRTGNEANNQNEKQDN